MTHFTPARLVRAADVLVRAQFAVRAGESVLITADTTTERALLDIVSQAVVRAGARPLIAISPKLPYQGGLSDPYVGDTLKAAAPASDVWFDFCFPYHAGSALHSAAMESGRCRYALLAMSSAASFERLYGGVDYEALIDFNLAFMEFVKSAAGEQVRFTCPLGSDVRFELDQLKLARPRVRDMPGMETVPGTQSLYPVMHSVQGRIVIQALFDEEYRKLRLPITIHVDGAITGLDGGGADDRMSFERALKRASGESSLGYFVHFTYGFHPGTRLTGEQFIEDIRIPGSNAIGMGLPWWEKGGGENHPDGVLFDQTLWIGGDRVCEGGRFSGPGRLQALHSAMVRRLD
jgi:leucyl aminopeptidase (aminopeptidase T)